MKMNNTSMTKFSILPPISDEILPLFCSDDLIQILINIGSVPNVKNQAIFRRICIESLEHNCGNNSLTIWTNILIFNKDTYLVLISRMISTKSYKITNPNFCDITLRHSMTLKKAKTLTIRMLMVMISTQTIGSAVTLTKTMVLAMTLTMTKCWD